MGRSARKKCTLVNFGASLVQVPPITFVLCSDGCSTGSSAVGEEDGAGSRDNDKDDVDDGEDDECGVP